MDLSAHLRAVLRRKWRILIASLLIAALVYGWRSQVPPTYEATALVNVVSSQSLQGEVTGEDETVFLSETYAALATTTPIAAEAAQRSGLDLTARQALRLVDVDVTNGSYLLVTATGPEPLDAAALSAAFADVVIESVEDRQREQTEQQLEPVLLQIQDVEQQLDELTQQDTRRTALELQYEALVQKATELRVRPYDRLTLVTPARASPDPIDPRPRRDTLLALIVALVVNSELAVVLSALAGRFTGESVAVDVTAATGIRVIGEIPQGSNDADPAVVEAFRSLRTSLLFLDSAAGLSSIAVVGGERGSGKSFVALNLCRSLAALDRDVVLIDGDLRNPALHEVFGVRRVPGLVDALVPPFDPAEPKQVPMEEPHLYFLPAGPRTNDPAGVLARSRFRQFVDRLQPSLVVVDTPPLGLFADGAAIALNCSSTLLVVDVDSARKNDLTRMITMLRRVGVEPVGIVLNRVHGQRANDYAAYRNRRRPIRSSRPMVSGTATDERRRTSPAPPADDRPATPGTVLRRT